LDTKIIFSTGEIASKAAGERRGKKEWKTRKGIARHRVSIVGEAVGTLRRSFGGSKKLQNPRNDKKKGRVGTESGYTHTPSTKCQNGD